MKTFNSMIVVAIVTIVASLTLAQAQAGWTEDFETGYTDNTSLTGQNGWGADGINHFPWVGTYGEDNMHSISTEGHDGSGGTSGWGMHHSVIKFARGATKLHGENTATGSTLVVQADLKIEPAGQEAYFGFMDSSNQVDSVHVGFAFGGSGIYFGNANSSGNSTLHPNDGTMENTFNPTNGDWFRVTMTHVIGGAPSLEFYRYSDGATTTATSSSNAYNEGNLDTVWFGAADGDGVSWDNITVSGTAVPEPTSAILLSLGLVTMLGCGRRNRR